MGKTDKLPVRLIAVKLPHNVAQKRRREYKKNRDRRCQYTKRTATLLGYQIFITNLHHEHFSASRILSFYGLRWRIEILFKVFKQHLNLAQLKEHTLDQVELLIYARLMLITVLLNFVYAPLRTSCSNGPPSTLSILKLSSWFDFFAPCLLITCSLRSNQILLRGLEQLPKHCCFEKRSRPNFLACFNSLG